MTLKSQHGDSVLNRGHASKNTVSNHRRSSQGADGYQQDVLDSVVPQGMIKNPMIKPGKSYLLKDK